MGPGWTLADSGKPNVGKSFLRRWQSGKWIGGRWVKRGWKFVLGRRKNRCQGPGRREKTGRTGGCENPYCGGLRGRALTSRRGALV